MSDKIRTALQNRSLHLMFKQLAELLNTYGLKCDDKIIDIDVPWSAVSVKENIWRPVQKAFSGKESTTELSTTDIDDIFKVIINSVSQRTGENLQWPSVESLINEQRLKD